MPRVTKICNPSLLGQPAAEPKRQVKSKSLENDIVALVGCLCLDIQDVKMVLGLRDDKAAKKWLEAENLLPVDINGRKKWLACDIAKALRYSQIRA